MRCDRAAIARGGFLYFEQFVGAGARGCVTWCGAYAQRALAQVIIDLSGRPYLVYQVGFPKGSSQIQNIPVSIFDDFFRALSNGAGMNLHINLQYGRDAHHILEAVFKGFGRALRMASEVHPHGRGVPSTKGIL